MEINTRYENYSTSKDAIWQGKHTTSCGRCSAIFVCMSISSNVIRNLVMDIGICEFDHLATAMN